MKSSQRRRPPRAVSERMKAVKSRGNASTELKMRRVLQREGITGWRRHTPITGTPDFCWKRERVALFVDGCFWHGCPRCKKIPKNYGSYWPGRIAKNKKHDAVVTRTLRSEDWRVVRVWECRVTTIGTISRLRRALGRRR